MPMSASLRSRVARVGLLRTSPSPWRCPPPVELSEARGSGGRIDTVVPLHVFEKVEIRGPCRPSGVLAAHSDERAGEVRRAGRRGFVGKDAGVENVRHPLPVDAVK